ncbi:MAG: restriction endonuclease subunit S [Rubrivivax sp.]|nr:restriction endonuclease subunit S [Rubrivivax sp.]
MAGWEAKPLGELCAFQRGLTYGKSDEVDVSSNVVLRANNVDLATHTLDLSDLRYISDTVSVPAAKRVRKGSLLICTASGSKAHLGKIAYVDADYGYAFGGFMGQISPVHGVNGRYLFHALTSPAYKAFIATLSDGVNINNLKFDDLLQFSVPVPGLDEQHRIVAILDEAFEGIATAKANAEKNLRNARELFELQLAVALRRGGEGWIEMCIGDACTLRSGTTVPVGIERSAGDVPYVKVAEMTMPANRDGVTTSIRFLNRADIKPSWLIPAGAVLFPKRGGAILTNKKRLALVDMCADLNIMSVIPSDKVTPEFLYLYFLTVDMRKLGTGSSIPQINNYDIAPLLISFPASRAKQAEVTEALRAAESECQALAATYERKLAALAELKKSLLHQAFSGAL